jgi:hypothetical protein
MPFHKPPLFWSSAQHTLASTHLCWGGDAQALARGEPRACPPRTQTDTVFTMHRQTSHHLDDGFWWNPDRQHHPLHRSSSCTVPLKEEINAAAWTVDLCPAATHDFFSRRHPQPPPWEPMPQHPSLAPSAPGAATIASQDVGSSGRGSA